MLSSWIGRARFNPAHFMARGITKTNGFSGVAVNGNIFDLQGARPATIAGAPTAKSYSAIGPTVDYTGGTDESQFTGRSTAVNNNNTFGLIFQLDSLNGGAGVLFAQSFNGGNPLLVTGVAYGASGASLNAIIATSLVSLGSYTFLTGVPYFVATSYSTTNYSTVILRLDTGQLLTFTGTGTFTAPASADGSYCIGNVTAFGAAQIGGGIAAAMFSPALHGVADLVQWAQDPWSFWYEPQKLNRAMLYSQAAASGTLVTATCGGGVEFLAGVRGDASVLLEYLASVRVDRPLQLEAIAALRRDDVCEPEFVAGLSAGVAAQLEFLGKVSADRLAPLEAVAALRADIVVLDEALGGLRSDAAAASEILAGLRADLLAPIEILGNVAVVTNAAVPIETLAKVTADQVADVELVSAMRADSAVGDEILAGVARSAPAPLEILEAVQASSAVPVENLGGVAVTTSAAVPIEVTAKLTADQVAGAELVSAARTDAAIGEEVLAGVARSSPASLEDVAAVQGNAALEVENLGGIAVTTSAAVPIEVIAKVRADGALESEQLSAMRADTAAGDEILAGVTRQAPAPVSFTSRVAAFAAAALEMLQTFVAGFVRSRIVTIAGEDRRAVPPSEDRRIFVEPDDRSATPGSD